MQRIFEVGMEVYDQVNFPGVKGKITEIYEDDKYPIKVRFEEHASTYTLEGRARKDQIPTLSTKPYKLVLDGFEQKSPVPTFEEVFKYFQNKGINYYTVNNLLAPNQEFVIAIHAFVKLLFLMNYYNEKWTPDWKPDWKEDSLKYCIESYQGRIFSDNYRHTSKVLAFKTPEIRNRFLEEQKELIEIAKPLL